MIRLILGGRERKPSALDAPGVLTARKRVNATSQRITPPPDWPVVLVVPLANPGALEFARYAPFRFAVFEITSSEFDSFGVSSGKR